MITFIFDKEYDYRRSGDDHRLQIVVRLLADGSLPLTVNALLDTGAEYSVFDKALLPGLGIAEVTKVGSPDDVIAIMPANLADESKKDVAYVHRIRIEWLGFQMTVPIAFCPSWDEGIDNLLGMRGFFEQLDVAVSHQNRMVYASSVSST